MTDSVESYMEHLRKADTRQFSQETLPPDCFFSCWNPSLYLGRVEVWSTANCKVILSKNEKPFKVYFGTKAKGTRFKYQPRLTIHGKFKVEVRNIDSLAADVYIGFYDNEQKDR